MRGFQLTTYQTAQARRAQRLFSSRATSDAILDRRIRSPLQSHVNQSPALYTYSTAVIVLGIIRNRPQPNVLPSPPPKKRALFVGDRTRARTQASHSNPSPQSRPACVHHCNLSVDNQATHMLSDVVPRLLYITCRPTRVISICPTSELTIDVALRHLIAHIQPIRFYTHSGLDIFCRSRNNTFLTARRVPLS